MPKKLQLKNIIYSHIDYSHIDYYNYNFANLGVAEVKNNYKEVLFIDKILW